MYTPIWNAVRAYVSAERIQADIVEFFEFSRWSSFDKIVGLAQRVADKMEAAGMEDVRLIEFPADGRTTYGGWVMPRAYNVHEARLTLLNTDDENMILADYHLNPVSLMLYSLPTPPEGIITELIVADTLEEMTPERLAGKLALTSGIGVQYSQAAMRAGACGLVSDCRNTHRFFKNGPEVALTTEWHNYTIAPWDDPGKGFGFSISPAQGRVLRDRLAGGETLRLHALVSSTHYDGVLPVISGRLPGLLQDEIVLTGHYDEYGADDNCSQIAVALETVRAIRAMLKAGDIPPLQRSIRVLLPMETRGFNVLIQDETETCHMFAGLNIDTVGTNQDRVTSTCTLSDNFAALPSYTEEFAAELLTRTAEENPLFRWRRTDTEMIDNIFGEPLIGAPTPSIWHYSATHHLATDTPRRISGRMLVDMSRVAATYAAFLANAGLKEALWLAELVADKASSRFQEIAARGLRGGNDIALQTAEAHRQLTSAYKKYAEKLGSPDRLVPALSFIPCPEIVETQRHNLVGQASLLPHEYFQERVSLLKAQLDQNYTEMKARMRRLSHEFFRLTLYEALPEEAQAPVSRCVPLKIYRGFVSFETLNDKDRDYVHNVLEIPVGWGAPMWLQNALMFANGKRTASEIVSLLHLHTGHNLEVKRLEQIFDFLATQEIVRLRPFLTQREVRATLEQTGIEKGDIVLGHFALSRFGYIERGAEALIDTLLSILGPDGTLVMPTFSFSWLGRQPYDRHKSPSKVGTVTDRFWRRPGVLRSEHSTHSFAAIGKCASAIIENHGFIHSPLSPDGPLGRLAELDGKILLFSPPTTNTIMHMGEYQAGLPLLNFICPVVKEGMRQEVIVPDCPWHVRFAPAYKKLHALGQVQEAVLGENTLLVMRGRDAIAAQANVMRETPEELLQPGCDCLYCQRLKQYCLNRTRRQA